MTRRLAIIAAVLAWPLCVQATTWPVQFDPDHPEGLVESAVAQASSGDTILIGPGTFLEHALVDGKTLTFLASGAPGTTILDGSGAPGSGMGSILYILGSQDVEIYIEGITFRNGQGSSIPSTNWTGGGAIVVTQPNYTYSLVLRVRDSVFEGNEVLAGSPGAARFGGAVGFDKADLVEFTSCVFRRNKAGLCGGAVGGWGDELRVKESTFEFDGDAGQFGLAIWCDSVQRFTLENSELESSATGDPGYAMQVITYDATLARNTFIDRGGHAATDFVVGTPGLGDPLLIANVIDNVFFNASGTGPGVRENGIWFDAIRGTITLERNTFASCRLVVEYGGGTPFQCHNNIFYDAPLEASTYCGGTLACNCSWPDSIATTFAGFTYEDNINLDPLFCNLGEGDLQIAHSSPCAGDNSPPGCGRIGALGAACSVTPVEVMSWGRLKNVWNQQK